ncbi:MAG: S4 domain-containing protein [bacterium]
MAGGDRLDHVLFRVRLFKSRSQATDACKQGRVQVNGGVAKSSTEVHAGDRLSIREKGLYREIRLLDLPGKNISKEVARELWQDETPEDVVRQRELIALAQRLKGPHQDQGARPVKKQRRDLQKLRRR